MTITTPHTMECELLSDMPSGQVPEGNDEQNLVQNQFLSTDFGKTYHHELNILSIGIPSAAIQ